MAVVFITGGSSGIGLATVRRLAAAGDQVFFGSRNPTSVPLPAGVTPVTLDVADPAAAERAVRAVTEAAGRLDVLVNNAATSVLTPLEETADADAERTPSARSRTGPPTPGRSRCCAAATPWTR